MPLAPLGITPTQRKEAVRQLRAAANRIERQSQLAVGTFARFGGSDQTYARAVRTLASDPKADVCFCMVGAVLYEARAETADRADLPALKLIAGFFGREESQSLKRAFDYNDEHGQDAVVEKLRTIADWAAGLSDEATS